MLAEAVALLGATSKVFGPNTLRCILNMMKQGTTVIQVDPGIMSGTPVFAGTRVPVQALLEYLEAGRPLAEFLEDFPTVTREQTTAALAEAKEALLSRARRPTEAAIGLLHSWVDEDSKVDGGLEAWEELKRGLDSNRTSRRRLFP